MANHGKGKQGAKQARGKQKAKDADAPRAPHKKNRARSRADVGKRRVPTGAHANAEGAQAASAAESAAGTQAASVAESAGRVREAGDWGTRAAESAGAAGKRGASRKPASAKAPSDAKPSRKPDSASRAVKPASVFDKAAIRKCPDDSCRVSRKPAPAARGKKPARAADSPCAVDSVCGGCSNISVPYKKQLVDKQVAIERMFSGLVDERAFRLVRGMKDPYHYRNKVISPFAPGKKIAPAENEGKQAGKGGERKPAARREILTGMYVAGTHELVPTDTCLIENEVAKKVTLAVRDIMRKHDIAPYREDTGEGFMRHAVVRAARRGGEVLVTLVTNTDEFPASKSFCRELIARCPEVTTVVQNVNERQTNVILGDKERVLFGPGFIFDELCGLSFRISSKSFYQVNAEQAEVLYECAMELAGLDGTQTVIDAYCGTGTIGLVAATRGAARVIGVDSVPDAIRDAQQNARHNGVENAEFVAADATEFMERLADEGLAGDAGELVVLMDPPRAGSTERFLAAAASLSPARIVYVSCNPETQVRDVEYLYDLGYRVVAVQPVDMFPHTGHIECVVCLEPDGAHVAALFPYGDEESAGEDDPAGEGSAAGEGNDSEPDDFARGAACDFAARDSARDSALAAAGKARS